MATKVQTRAMLRIKRMDILRESTEIGELTLCRTGYSTWTRTSTRRAAAASYHTHGLVREALLQRPLHDIGQRHQERVQALRRQDEGARLRLLVGHLNGEGLAIGGDAEGRQVASVDDRHVRTLVIL